METERRLASVREVKEIWPIEKADAIEVAVIDGWECVVKKSDNFKVGDKVVYIEVDSIVPEKPEFEFLRERKFRVRTIKLRGQVSQGLVLPISYLGEGKFKLDQDVTKLMGITKYDPELQAELKVKAPEPKSKVVKYLIKYKWFRKLRKKFVAPAYTRFPEWISKTNETRIQNLYRKFEYFRTSGEKFIATEKLDGQSGTFAMEKKHTYLFSRNLGVSKRGSSNYARVFKSHNIEDFLRSLKEHHKATRVFIQGEICGPGIQKNKYQLKELKYFVFNIFVDGKRLSYKDTREELTRNEVFLDMVPVAAEDLVFPETIKELVEMSKGQSQLLPRRREGLVIRTKEYTFSFKVINPDFLLEIEKKAK